ncbi:MAG: hypothetical protein V1790_04860 [Planctomycetota bacterium]
MIEFKAECGHTVRARDEDAGGVVRCSYCGRNAAVPDNANSDLDFLFSEVQQTEEPDARSRRRKKKREQRLLRRKKRTPGEFNPFAVVLRLIYAAALAIIVIVVARKFVIPMFDAEKWAQLSGGANPTAPPPKRDDAGKAASRARGPGLIRETKVTGLYVGSTPTGASVYCVDESKAPASGRIHQVAGCTQFRANGEFPHPADGSYVVEVAFPWNDPTLSDYPNYFEFRKHLEPASHEQRKRLADEYFIPDEASAVFVDQTEDQIYIVRQYRGVAVRQGQSKGVRSLFLPKIRGSDPKAFLIEPLVSGYIPNAKTYEFDEKHVRSELAYYGVAVVDQPFVLEALSRIGLIPYVAADRRVRLFKVGVQDGVFATRVIREASE